MRLWSAESDTAQVTTHGRCLADAFLARNSGAESFDGVMCTGMVWKGVSGIPLGFLGFPLFLLRRVGTTEAFCSDNSPMSSAVVP